MGSQINARVLPITPGLNDQCNGNIAFHELFLVVDVFYDLVQNKKSNMHGSTCENDRDDQLDDAYCHSCR